jgi:hypothetical protein
MRKIILSLFLFSILTSNAQDALPDFAVINRGNNRIVISWINQYPAVKQISIQRSFDSLNNFKTILTVPDPMNPQNGFMDSKAVNDHMYYRLYVHVDGANFLVTKAQRPFHDSILMRIVSKSLTDSALTAEESAILKRYQSIRFDPGKTPPPANNKTGFAESPYSVATNSEGNVRIRLNDFVRKKYSIKFFEEDDSFLFELKEIKEPFLILDKSNFYHAGWFKFELYDDGKLVEKFKFYLTKDF